MQLANGDVSPLELVEVCQERIDKDRQIVECPTYTVSGPARKRAKSIQDEETAGDGSPLWLGGLPIAVKDLNDVAGVRTTYGSTVFANHVPDQSDYTVERLESNGAVIVAKSNTPEFGAGGATFNDVFGPTANPWDIDRNAGGSSGGSAAAVAAGILLGVVESLWGGFVSTGYMDVIGFVMVILILLFRPAGLFSKGPGG